jgi:hypothetical protein
MPNSWEGRWRFRVPTIPKSIDQRRQWRPQLGQASYPLCLAGLESFASPRQLQQRPNRPDRSNAE